AAKSMQDALHRSGIAPSKEVQVVEQVVEVVDLSPLWIPRLKGPGLGIGLVEGRGERAEKLRHSQIGFPVAHGDGGVDEPRHASFADDVVSTPEIAVEKRALRPAREEG